MNVQLYFSRSSLYAAALGLALTACAVDVAETSAIEQPGITMQGITMQGITMQGITMQGMNMQGMRFEGASLAGSALDDVHVERGELVGRLGTTVLRGTALVDAHLLADVRNLAVTPPAQAVLEYRITAIRPEEAQYDPTHTGNTFLYTLEQRVPETDSWRPACPVDLDGRSAAIPLTATWDEHGDRIESTTRFTFACTTGVIAKCYRWGYRPWVSGYGDMVETHWACTRLARADYCGNGVSHTREGTLINIWDNLPGPGPIQRHGLLPPLGMVFEAGWSSRGAVCLSRSRWLLDDGLAIAAACPDRLVPLGLGQTICNTVSEVLDHDSGARLFNESSLLNL